MEEKDLAPEFFPFLLPGAGPPVGYISRDIVRLKQDVTYVSTRMSGQGFCVSHLL